jgi:hypothetical protein
MGCGIANLAPTFERFLIDNRLPRMVIHFFLLSIEDFVTTKLSVNDGLTRQNIVLQDADENGDGTVPRRSGIAPTDRRGVQVCVPYQGIDHEGAYKNKPQQLFALWAITKIAFSVRHTNMAYADFKFRGCE